MSFTLTLPRVQPFTGLKRALQAAVAALPLAVLLVGSCDTSQLPFVYRGATESQRFIAALFPANQPAAGYVDRARDVVSATPSTLGLLTQKEIGYLYGTPTLHRRDAEAEVWQYKAEGCVVDLYFYGAKTPVAHMDVRRNGLPGRAEDCLKVISSSQNLFFKGA